MILNIGAIALVKAIVRQDQRQFVSSIKNKSSS
jgi:hypothetical protein